MYKRLLAGAGLWALIAGHAQATTLDVYADVSYDLSYSTVVYPFQSGQVTEQRTYIVNLPAQSKFIALPTLADYGVAGTLNSITFGGDLIASGIFSVFYEAFAGPDEFGGPDRWFVHGSHRITGKYRLFANHALMDTANFEFFVNNGCSSPPSGGPGGCSVSFFDYAGGAGGTYYGSDLPIVYSVIDELRIEGRFNDDLGDVRGGQYSADWGISNELIMGYDYTATPPDVPQVPLPGAIWLLLSSLAGLVALAKTGRSRVRPA